MKDLSQVLPIYARLLVNNTFDFRDLAFREIVNLQKSQIVRYANKLLNCELSPDQFDWHSPGIRAQLFDNKKNKI